MDDDDFETLGRMVDRLDNAVAATQLPLPPDIHIAGMKGIIESVRDDLKKFLADKGFDPWDE